MTVAEVASVLKLNQQTVRNRMCRGKLQALPNISRRVASEPSVLRDDGIC
jgi:hypothetical protein